MAHVIWGASEVRHDINRVVFVIVQEDVVSVLDSLECGYPTVEVSDEDTQALCKWVASAVAEVTGNLVEEIAIDYLEEREREIEKDNRRIS